MNKRIITLIIALYLSLDYERRVGEHNAEP